MSRSKNQSLFYQTAESVCRRDEIYLLILSRGLHRIRDAGYAGDAGHCEIEAEHLHNLPEYLAQGDTAPHAYYFVKQRPFYLNRIDMTSEANRLLLDIYEPLWRELEELIPIFGTPWEQEWLSLKASRDATSKEKKDT